MPYAKIISAAKYLPPLEVSNNRLAELVDTSDEWIYTRTGIKRRRVSTDETTSELCAKVLRQLLEQSGLGAEDIQAIIIATTTPDMLTPTTACITQSKTGAKNAFAFDIGAGCSGFVYALGVAEKFIRTGSYDNIVVIGAETLSKCVDWSDRATCVLFGDGAGGVLLQASDDAGILAEDIHSDASNVYAIHGHSLPLSSPFSNSEGEPDPFFNMDGRAVFDFAIREVPKSINALLAKSGLAIDDIDYIVPHQANYRIVEAVAKKLKLPMNKFFTNMEHYGNTSAASIPIALTEMAEKGVIRIGSGQRLILCGFGSGLTWGSILLQI